MPKYILKFSKEGNIKYISHLDVLRLFQRSFKRSKVKLKYSQGFNPHAKISFAQPLSLGYESFGEYVEIETEPEYSPEELQTKLNDTMPKGLSILDCRRLDIGKKTLAAVVSQGRYTIRYHGEEDVSDGNEKIKLYMNQEHIMSKKFNKKAKKMVEIDIKPMILSCEGKTDATSFYIDTMVATGSNGNLNPDQIIDTFCAYLKINYIKHHWKFTREELYFDDETPQGIQRPLLDLVW